MPYPTLPGRAIPYHLDGTVVKVIDSVSGVVHTFTAGGDLDELNDEDLTRITGTSYDPDTCYIVFFFPEKREIDGLFGMFWRDSNQYLAPSLLEGSNNTTNGIDGDWTAIGTAFNPISSDFDSWRDDIKTYSHGTAYETVRVRGGANYGGPRVIHLYGFKESGQTPDDLVFLDPDNGTAEFTEPMNFGDVEAGQSEQLTFIVKNESAGSAADSITLTVTDPDDIIRVGTSSAGPWQTSLSLGNLGPGSSTPILYCKSEPAAPPTPLEPERATIDVEVGSWS